jgi:Arc/MetJ family transcription regulator
MVKRTTINLEAELVAQACEVLKTRNTTDTVHGALREVIRRDRLRRLAERDWGMAPDELKELRRSRVETRSWGALYADLDDLRPASLHADLDDLRPASLHADLDDLRPASLDADLEDLRPVSSRDEGDPPAAGPAINKPKAA